MNTQPTQNKYDMWNGPICTRCGTKYLNTHVCVRFARGDVVRKVKGYPFDSVVLSVFKTMAGETRIVCESSVIPGLIHIFNPDQMER